MSVARRILLGLLLWLLMSFALGTWIRLRLEKPTVYLGAASAAYAPAVASGGPAPLDVGDPGPPVLDPRQDEEQIG